MSSPIRKALEALLAKKSGDCKPCQINYRPRENYWVIPGANEVSVFFEVDFESKTD